MTDLASAYCSHPIPAGVKDTINKFYRLLDIYTGTACRQWAELFTSDGEVLIEARDNLHVTGREALEAERRQSWTKLEKRDHRTDAIFVRDKEGTDVVVLGVNEVTMRNGVVFSQGYAQRFMLRKDEGDGYLIVRFQSYLDSAPIAKAIAAAPLKPQPPMPE